MKSIFNPTAREDFETSYHLFEKKVVIRVTKNLERPKRSRGGISLPDEHEKRAIIKDRLHLERLKGIPHFERKYWDTLLKGNDGGFEGLLVWLK